MAEKRYGVNISLINQLKAFQSSLRTNRKNLSYIGRAWVAMEKDTKSFPEENHTLSDIKVDGNSVNMFDLGLTLHLTPKTVLSHFDTNTTLTVGALHYNFVFDDAVQKNKFVEALPDFVKIASSSSKEESSPDSGDSAF